MPERTDTTDLRESRLAAHLLRRWGLDPNTPLGERMTEDLAAALAAVTSFHFDAHFRESSEELCAEFLGVYAGFIREPAVPKATLLPPECYQYYRFLTDRIDRGELVELLGEFHGETMARVAEELGAVEERLAAHC